MPRKTALPGVWARETTLPVSFPPLGNCTWPSFAYLIDSENVRAALAALPMREQCALVDLVQFLRAGSGDSPLKTLQRLCNEAIKAAALALTQ